MKARFLMLCGLSNLVLASLSAPVRAQDVLPSAEPKKDGAIETIVVTANRRETALQDVPFSIIAFGADQISEQRIERAEDLFQAIPGAVFVPNVKTASYVGIRGLLTLEDAPAADLPIAFFVDDVYVAGTSDLNLNYFDLERIEVLRGPQGTLFGRNVIGGAISFVSKRPRFKEEFGVRMSVADDRRIDVEGYANGVIVPERLAARLSFSSRHSDGYVYNRTRGERLEDDNTVSLRGQFLFTPSENLEVLGSAYYTSDRGKGSSVKLINFDPSLVPPLDPDPWVVDQDFDTRYDRELWGGALRMDYDTGIGTLSTVTAFRRNSSRSGRDVDATPLPIVHSNEFVDNRQFTQELRLASDETSSLSYVAGLYYLNAHNYRLERQRWSALPGSILALALGGSDVKVNDQSQDARIKSYALFGEATYRLSDQWSVALGARYTIDRKTGYSAVTGPLNPIVKNIAGDRFVPFAKTWEAFTPRIVIRFEPTDDLNFYATIARGFKGGGFTAGLPTEVGLATPFDPEKATNYEIGAKTSLFDRRMQLNMTVFRQDTDDLQVRAFNEFGVSIVGNAASARVQGVELESTAALTDFFRLTANYTYLDAIYRNFRLGPTDFSGNHLPAAPKHSLILGGQAEVPLGNVMLVLAADYNYRSSVDLLDTNAVPDPIKSQSAQNIFDASIDLHSKDKQWQLSIWGKNLTNEASLLTAQELTSFWATPAESAGGARGFFALYGRSRTYGATVTYRF